MRTSPRRYVLGHGPCSSGARTRMALPALVSPVSNERLRSCAPISSGHFVCWGARASNSSTVALSKSHPVGDGGTNLSPNETNQIVAPICTRFHSTAWVAAHISFDPGTEHHFRVESPTGQVAVVAAVCRYSTPVAGSDANVQLVGFQFSPQPAARLRLFLGAIAMNAPVA